MARTLTGPFKLGREMLPKDASSQQRSQPGSTEIPVIVIEDTSEPPSGHLEPPPARQQPATVRPSVEHGAPFENSVLCSLDELPRDPLAAESAAPLEQGRPYSSQLKATCSPPTTPRREIVPPNTRVVKQEHSQVSRSVTWPPLQFPSRPPSQFAKGTTRQLEEDQSPQRPRVNKRNTGVYSRTLRQILSTPPTTRCNEHSVNYSRRIERVRRNIAVELQIVPLSAETQQFSSPISQPAGETPFCSTPLKQYRNGIKVPDSSSCPASPLRPLTDAHEQPAENLRLRHTAPLDHKLLTLDERQAQAVRSPNETPGMRRHNYAARQPTPHYPRKTKPPATRKRTADGDQASHVNTSSINLKNSIPHTGPSQSDRKQSPPSQADTSSLQEVCPASQSDALVAAITQLARTSPQMIQLMLGIGQTWEVLQEAWPSVQRVWSCLQTIREPLEAVTNSLKEAQRKQASSANDGPGNIPHQGTPDKDAPNHQRPETDRNAGALTENASKPPVNDSNASPEINTAVTLAAVDMQSSVPQHQEDMTKVLASLKEQSSHSNSDGSVHPNAADTKTRGSLPVTALTHSTAANVKSDEAATGNPMIAQSTENEVKVPSAAALKASWSDNRQEPESSERHSCPYEDPASSKKPTSQQLPFSRQIRGDPSNVKLRAPKGMTPSSYWEAAAESRSSADSRATRNFRLGTNESSCVTAQTPKKISEKRPYAHNLQRSCPTNIGRREITPVQDKNTKQGKILFDISTPDQKTDSSLVGGSHPPTPEPTSELETRRWSVTKKEPGLVQVHSTEGTETCLTTAEQARRRNSDCSTAGANVDHSAEALLAVARKLSLQNMAPSKSHSMMSFWNMTQLTKEGHLRRIEQYRQTTYEHANCTSKKHDGLLSESNDRRDGQIPHAMEVAVPALFVAPPPVTKSTAPQPGEMHLTRPERYDGADISDSRSTDQAPPETEYKVSTAVTRESSARTRKKENRRKSKTAPGSWHSSH